MGCASYFTKIVFSAMILNSHESITHGLLYPRESETREVKSLDGMWNFFKSDTNNPTQGIREKWFNESLSKTKVTIPMPVPSSYNDITVENELRDHVGTVWYDRTFFVPLSWEQDKKTWIRFGSVSYEAFVWINSEMVVKHEFGHLPFEADISKFLKYGQENLVTVLCDNALIQTTIPQGKITEIAKDDGVEIVQSYTFDFFNYAGIHRSVSLYTTPVIYIEDVIVTTMLDGENGHVYYKIIVGGNETEDITVNIQIKNKDGIIVANDLTDFDLKGISVIEKVNPWWPYLMHPEPGYLYTMEVHLSTPYQNDVDIYRLKIGIRSITWNETSFLINEKPIYFRGFGRHEDSDIRGKGLDLALLTRDFNLIKWIGANAYRTSHYPYSEESMQMADEFGIMVIDECPSVDTENYSTTLLEKHKSSIEQLIHRDKNHACVVMWSIANEPRTQQMNADTYFGAVANYTKSLDPTRPITAAIAVPLQQDKAAKYLDIISFNRYNGWYSNPGKLNMITDRVVEEAVSWNTKHNKPVLMSEYGADTVEGLHMLPSFVWSEEYQTALFSQHFKAFDILRKKNFFIGEFVWNFADFKTPQTVNRVGGNKKGIFTRNREPKSAAHHLRQRYFALSQVLDKSTVPDNLFLYLIGSDELHTEL